MRLVKKCLLFAAVALVGAAAITLFAWVNAPHYFDLIVFRPGDWKISPQKEITVADARADLAVLERAMRTGYVGYDYFRQQGTDWDALFAQADASFADHSTIPICDFAATVNKLFRSVNDQHLNVWNDPDCKFPRHINLPLASNAWFRIEGDEAFVVDPAPAGVPIGSRLVDCEGRALANDLHLTARKVGDQWQFERRIIYLAQKRREKITCHFQAPDGDLIKARIAMTMMFDWTRQENTIEVTPGEPLNVRLGTFSPKEESEMSPFLDSSTAAAAAQAIVIDLRGNRGGTDRYFYVWSRDLYQGDKKFGRKTLLTSETTRQAWINIATEELAFHKDSATMRAWFSLEAVKDFAALVAVGAFTRGSAQWKVESRPRHLVGKAQQPFGGEMVLVVDRTCASACEGAVTVARGVFDALVIGTNTRGVHVFIEPLPYRLPKSGLVVRMARKMMAPSEQKNDSFCEGRGFAPDIWIDLRDGGAMAREFGKRFGDPAFRAKAKPQIHAAGERWRTLSVY